jgi:hypothetical protein
MLSGSHIVKYGISDRMAWGVALHSRRSRYGVIFREFQNGHPARKPDLYRALARKLAALILPDCDGARLTVPTLSPMTGRHTHEFEHVILLSRNPRVANSGGGRNTGLI